MLTNEELDALNRAYNGTGIDCVFTQAREANTLRTRVSELEAERNTGGATCARILNKLDALSASISRLMPVVEAAKRWANDPCIRTEVALCAAVARLTPTPAAGSEEERDVE